LDPQAISGLKVPTTKPPQAVRTKEALFVRIKAAREFRNLILQRRQSFGVENKALAEFLNPRPKTNRVGVAIELSKSVKRSQQNLSPWERSALIIYSHNPCRGGGLLYIVFRSCMLIKWK